MPMLLKSEFGWVACNYSTFLIQGEDTEVRLINHINNDYFDQVLFGCLSVAEFHCGTLCAPMLPHLTKKTTETN